MVECWRHVGRERRCGGVLTSCSRNGQIPLRDLAGMNMVCSGCVASHKMFSFFFVM